MAQQDEVLNTAINEIGTIETGYGDNWHVKYSDEFGKPNKAWCVMFVWWVFVHSGYFYTIDNFRTASCGEMYTYALNHGMVSATGKRGDIVIYSFKQPHDHMGIVESCDSDYVVSIEGNTRTDGGDGHPCYVARQRRRMSNVFAFIRPKYTDSVVTPTPSPTYPVYTYNPVYAIDPALDFTRVLHIDLDPIENTVDLYDRITEILQDAYGLITPEVTALYEDMDTSTVTKRNAWNRIIQSEYTKFVLLWEGSSLQKYIYILIGAMTEIGVVDIQYNALAGFRIRVYDTSGVGITSDVQITVVSPSRQYSFRYPYPSGYYDFNCIGGYYLLSNGYGTGSTYFFEPNDMDIRTNSFTYEVIDLETIQQEVPDPEPDPNPEGVIYMYLNIWRNFSKRINSTLQPVDGERLEILLMKNTSLKNPVIQLKSTILDYNYFQLFGRFYYVKDCVALRNGMIELTGEIDPLATYKSSIYSTNAYVERSASSYNDKLEDNLVDVEAQDEVTTTTLTSSEVWFNNVGVFVLTVINNLSNTNMFSSYMMLPSEMEKLSHYFNINFNNWSGINDLLSWLQAISFKTAGAVIDLKWLPLIATFPTQAGSFSTAEDIKVGEDVLTGIYGYRYLETNPTTDDLVFSASSIGYSRSDFRRQNPYTRLRAFIPFYGFVELNPLDFPEGIKLQYNLDYLTGDCVVLIQSVENNVTTTVESVRLSLSAVLPTSNGNKGGVDIPVLSSLSQSFSSPVFGSSYSGGGGVSGRAWSLTLTPFLEVIEKQTTVVTNVLGRPVNRNFTLQNLSGYCKCKNASVACIADPELKAQIDNYLNSGFFIE